MSRSALNRAMKMNVQGGAAGTFGDPFEILEPYRPSEEHLASAMEM